MPRSRKGACALAVLALACAPVLSGCAGGEAQPASAESQSGVLGGLIAQLKREDDENEVRELAEQAPVGKEEREEAEEQAEQLEVEAGQAQESEQPSHGEEQPSGEEQPRALEGQES
jgi:hypothetical protein